MDDLADRLTSMRERLLRCRSTPLHAEAADGQTVLRERARQLAQKLPRPEAGEVIEVVQFRLGRQRLAIESAWVKEVFSPREVVPVPGTPPFVAGIINHRGSILSVVDLGKVLGLSADLEMKPSVVLYLRDGEMEFGVLVEEVEAALQVSRRAISAVPPTLSEEAARYLRGVLPGAVSLIDARLLLAAPQLRVE
jgi:purine-binding chemotaxis protein CheW